MRRRLPRLALLGGLLLLAPGPGLAQGLDLTQGGPIEITSTDGIEWRQQEQVVIARGNARAARAGVVLEADRLLARYRDRGGAPAAAAAQPGAPPRPAAPPGRAETPLSGGEIWRLEAEGRVRIATAAERAQGERAVYDMDQAVMVLSGRDLQLTTADQRITARDSLEYYPQRRMAVARGGAVVTTADGRRITADTLVAYFLEDPAAAGGATAAAAAPRPAPPAPGRQVPGSDGRIDRVEAYGEVEIRTEQEVVRGERGVYSPVSGLARLLGNVRITRGDNHLNGQEAIVNLRSGVARLVSAPGQRVQGLVVPQAQQPGPAQVPTPQVPAQPGGGRAR